MANTCLGGLAYEYMQKGQYSQAAQYLELFENHSLLNEETISFYEEWKLLYYYKGYYYLKTGALDSALFYFNKVIQVSSSVNNVLLGNQGLYLTYDNMGIADSAKKYAIRYAVINDSTNKQATSSSLLSMQHLYDYSRFQHVAYVKTIVANRAMRFSMLLAFFILILLLVAIFSVIYIRQRSALVRGRIKNQYAKNQMRYEREQRKLEELKQQQQVDKDALQKTQAALDYLEKVLEETRKSYPNIEEWDSEENYQAIPIVNRMKTMAARGLKLSDQDWIELRQSINTLLPGFIESLCNLGYELNLKETNICILIKLGFSPTDIKNLMDMSSSSLANLRKRLLCKLFKIDGSPGKLDEMIRMNDFSNK